MKRVVAALLSAVLFSLASMPALADDPDPNPKLFGAFWFLVGSCWEGYFEGSETDRIISCFRPMYRGKAIRMNFVVIQGGERQIGETVFAWDGAEEVIRYQTVDSFGGSSTGVATPDQWNDQNERITFPPADYVTQDGEAMRFQNRYEKVSTEQFRHVAEAITADGTETVMNMVLDRKLLSYGPRP